MGKRSVHFLHVRKTGGTAIKSALEAYPETDKYVIKLHGHDTSIKDVPNGEYIIFCLRDPVSRFVSGFYSRQRKGRPRYFHEWRPEEREVYERYSTPNDLALALFDADPSAIKAMNSIRHFRKYSDWYLDVEYFKSRIEDVLFVGFQESLDRDFLKLKKILGLPKEVELPTDDVLAHKKPKDLDGFVDANGIAALNEWFAADVEFLKLCQTTMANRSCV